MSTELQDEAIAVARVAQSKEARIKALKADNAKLREQLAKADQHIKLHCSDLASRIIQDSNKA